jgi:probable phosphoglycerate mutase
MKTTLALVRHGVTAWNYEARAQGHVDIPLSPEGLQQAELVAERLAREPWDAVYSSPLSRARQTAEVIGRRLNLPVRQDPRLMERYMGHAEGMTIWDRAARWPGLHFHEIPEMEQDEALAARAQTALRDLARQHAGERLICVAHGAFIHHFLQAIAPETALGFRQRNTAVTEVEFDGERFRLLNPPDFRHLLREGIDYTGEKGRISPSTLAAFLGGGCTPEVADAILKHATAIESAWLEEPYRLVGFARAFTDGVRFGHIDLLVTTPGYEQVREVLVARIQARYPAVTFTQSVTV